MSQRVLQLNSAQFDALDRAITELDPDRIRMRTPHVLSATWAHVSMIQTRRGPTAKHWLFSIELDATRDDRGRAQAVIRTSRYDWALLLVAVTTTIVGFVIAGLARSESRVTETAGTASMATSVSGVLAIAGWAFAMAGIPWLVALVWWRRVRVIRARFDRVLARAGIPQ